MTASFSRERERESTPAATVGAYRLGAPDARALARLRSKRAAPRSRHLLEAVAALDTAPDESARLAVTELVRADYESRGGGIPLGLFGRCSLGAPYVDHVMSLEGVILEHFTLADTLSVVYAAARPLVAHSAYAFVEFYDDGQLVPVRLDGSSVR